MSESNKPGFKTSEFWLTVILPLVPYVLDTLRGKVGEDTIWYALICAAAAAVYTFNRTWQKKTPDSETVRKEVLDVLGGGPGKSVSIFPLNKAAAEQVLAAMGEHSGGTGGNGLHQPPPGYKPSAN